MKVAVLGGGVIGVTTAYYLARSGHDVELFERRGDVALETSFANAGEVCPGCASPWAGPGVLSKALKWLTMRHGPLVIRPKADPEMWLWLLAMLRNCSSSRYALNKARMMPLAEYSRDCLRKLREETKISYDEGCRGTIQLFRTQKELDQTAKDVEMLRDFGVAYEILDAQGCLLFEPGLHYATTPLVGGLRLPGDETGDCRMFTQKVAALSEASGVLLRLRTCVTDIVTEGGRVTGIATTGGIHGVDACVVALGCVSPTILKSHGIRLPIYPIKGYSLTLPIVAHDAAPVSTVLDDAYKTAITRLGDRIRIGGTAELAGFDLTLGASRIAALEHSLTQLFPAGGDRSRAQFWCGLRPMTPDGPPIIGATQVRGMYINSGHGTLGWTMACGSAQALADIISGRDPAVDVSALLVARYR